MSWEPSPFATVVNSTGRYASPMFFFSVIEGEPLVRDCQVHDSTWRQHAQEILALETKLAEASRTADIRLRDAIEPHLGPGQRMVLDLSGVASALLAIMGMITVALPPHPDWHNQDAFAIVFGFVPRIVAAGRGRPEQHPPHGTT